MMVFLMHMHQIGQKSNQSTVKRIGSTTFVSRWTVLYRLFIHVVECMPLPSEGVKVILERSLNVF